MSHIVQFLPVERLDDLVKATGFDLDRWDYESKYQWLLERIGMLRDKAETAAILHDNPEKEKLIALIEFQRRDIAALQNTINTLTAQITAQSAKT